MLKSAGHGATRSTTASRRSGARAAEFDARADGREHAGHGRPGCVETSPLRNRRSGSPPFVAPTADATEETRRHAEEAGSRLDQAGRTWSSSSASSIAWSRRPAAREPGPPPETAFWPQRGASAPVLDRPTGPLASAGRLRRFLGGRIGLHRHAEQLVEELEALALDVDVAAFRNRARAFCSSAAHLGASALFDLPRWRGIGPAELTDAGADTSMQLRSGFERLRGRSGGAGAAGPRARSRLSRQQPGRPPRAPASEHNDAAGRPSSRSIRRRSASSSPARSPPRCR